MDGEDLDTLYEEIYERFGIEFDSYLTEVGTVGDLYHYILWKLGLEKRDAACLCPPTFFALRKAMVERLGANSIGLDTNLAKLFPWWRRRRMWSKLSDAMGLELPKLEDAPGAAIGAAVAWATIALPLTVLLVAWLIDEESSELGTAAAVLLGLCLQVPVWILLVQFSRCCQFRLPHDCRTVGQLVECLVALNPNHLRRRYHPQPLEMGSTPLGDSRPRSRCTYLPAFLQIRKSLAETTGNDPKTIRGDTHLAEVVGRFGRRTTWRLLEFNLQWELPELKRSRFVVGLCIAGYVAILAMNVRHVTDAPLIWWMVIPYAVLAYLCTLPFAVHFPKGCELVKDLAVAVLDLNYGRIAESYNSLNAGEVWSILRRLVANTANVDADDVGPDTPLIDTVGK